MSHEIAIQPDSELRIVTASSVWIIRPSTYMRLPRHEAPRPQELSIDGALDDAEWHRHQGIWVTADLRGFYLRILPAARPAGLRGITTGTVQEAHGTAWTVETAA